MNSIKNIALLALSCCVGNINAQESLKIEHSILKDSSSFYYVNFNQYTQPLKNLPIGVFDSGTGGLTVLDALVNFDQFNNQSKDSGKDEKPDFASEKFVYLADQANMPYGNYHATNKDNLLKEHIIKDFQFLLANKYYPSALDKNSRNDKQQVKAIVIACNTATAYGYEEAAKFVDKTGLNIPIVGVINAAARGTLSFFEKNESGSIGVFATVGTISSGGYERTLKEQIKNGNWTGNIQIFNQGGHGLAEAVDEEPDFIQTQASVIRDNYRGPSLANTDHQIDRALLQVYNFNFADNKMICDSKQVDDCTIMQLNDTENYVRYHLVSLLEKMRKAEDAQPLKALILGCTHYPYLVKEINLTLEELRNYKDQHNKYIYKHLLADHIEIVDPSIYVAQELYAALKQNNLFGNGSDMWNQSEFFISVPNTDNSDVLLDEIGRFTYDYKYGREEGNIQEYVKVVPFDKTNVSMETLHRLEKLVPNTFKLIKNFSRNSDKLGATKPENKI